MIRDPAEWSQRAIFYVAIGYSCVGLGGAFAYTFNLLDVGSRTIADVPIEMLWFGAVGAITISLQAIFQYQDSWESKYNLWHLGRPIMGAILGMMSYLMLRTIVALGSSESLTEIPDGIDLFPYRILAFVVGYREKTFRALLKRVIDVILGPGEPDSSNNRRDDSSNDSNGSI
jgi:uncharacterized membrane protein (Fun14 family)